MNPFLKKEWKDLELPEKSYLRARNRAWARLRRSEQTSFLSFWPKAGLAFLGLIVVAVAIFLVREPDEQLTRHELTQVQSAAQSQTESNPVPIEVEPPVNVDSVPILDETDTESEPNQSRSDKNLKETIQEEVKASSESLLVVESVTPTKNDKSPASLVQITSNKPMITINDDINEPQQLVMHFQLPETGIRMIWVKDDLTNLEN